MATTEPGDGARRTRRTRRTRGRGRGRAQALAVLVALALPWGWYVGRDAGSLFDLVATGMPAVAGLSAALAVLAAAVLRQPAALVLAGSTLAMGATAVAGPWRPTSSPAPEPALRVVAANAMHHNPAVGQAAADLVAQQGDVVVVVEGALAVYEQLRGSFPFAELGPEAEHTVLSRYPVDLLPPPAAGPGDPRVTRWQIEAPAGPVILYAVHLRRPRARQTEAIRAAIQGQRDDVRDLLRSAAGETLPVIVAGDLNVSDRASGYRLLHGSMRDAMRAEPAGPTYLRRRYRPFLLRIDHLFVPAGWCAADSRRFRIEGSDHKGIVAEVGPCPDEPGD